MNLHLNRKGCPMSQRTKYIFSQIFWSFLTALFAGSVLQTFLLENSFSEEKVSLFVSVLQLIQIATIFCFSAFADHTKSVIRSIAVIHFLFIPFFSVMIAVCISGKCNYWLFLAVAVIAYIASGFYNILYYKLPYHIMDMKYYGGWTGVSCAWAGVFMCGFAVSLSFLQQRLGYLPAMQWIGLAGLVVAIGSVILILSFQRVHNPQYEKKTEKISLLHYKPFTRLIIPNLLRGFCTGLVGMAVTIGYFTDKLNVTSANYLLIITQTVSIPASILYTKLAGKEKKLLLFTGVIIAVGLALMPLFGTVCYLAFYGVVYFCISVVNMAVPVLVADIIDYQIAGQYNGWRMLLHSAGNLSASSLCVILLKGIGAFGTLTLAGLCQLGCGIYYYIYCNRHKKIVALTNEIKDVLNNDAD